MSRRKNRRNRRRAQGPVRLDDVIAQRLPATATAVDPPVATDAIDAATPSASESVEAPAPPPRLSATDAWMRELHAGVERRRRRRRIVWSEALDVRSLLYMGIALVVAFLVFAVLRWMEWRDVTPRPGF